MENELFKPVALSGGAFASFYEVSSDGRIRSIRNGRFLRATDDGKGYLHVTLVAPSMKRCIKVHVIVADAFLGPRQTSCSINHKDGCKAKNQVSNLEYVTQLENLRHATRTGLRANVSKKSVATREKNGTRGNKISFDQAQVIRRLVSAGNSMRSVGVSFGIRHQTVSEIVAGKYWNPAPVTDE